MKTSRKTVAVATLGILAGLVPGWLARGWWTPAAKDSATTEAREVGVVLPALGRPRGGGTDDDAASARGAQSASLRKLIAQLVGADSDAGLERFSSEQFDAYLQRHQRDARSLLAVYAFTGDTALLREAYEKHPENLLVAEGALASLGLSIEEKLALLEKVRTAHPDNALGDILTANVLGKEGRGEEGWRYLQSAFAKTNLDYGEREQRLALREAMMSVGKSPTEARLLGWTRHSALPVEINKAAAAGIKEMKQRLNDGREEEAFALAGPMLAFGQRLEQRPGANLMTELISRAIQRAILKSLPAEVEIGETGETAEQLFQKVDEQGKRVSRIASSSAESGMWHLQHFDEAGVELYFQIAEERGERAAFEWAEAYHGPAPTKEQ